MGDWTIGRSKSAPFSWLLEGTPASVASYGFQPPSAVLVQLLAPALLPKMAGPAWASSRVWQLYQWEPWQFEQ